LARASVFPCSLSLISRKTKTATAIIGYLQSERVLRPVAVAALRGGLPENIRASGVIGRQMLAWALSTGVPLLAIVLAVVADKAEYLHGPPEKLLNPILLLALLALGIGLASTLLVAMSIADPLRQLRWALGEVQRGNYNAHMQIYDASELGLLQAGFNDMVRDLSERQRLRDLFGRYVGEDVARRALERGTELGGQERDVAVLYVPGLNARPLDAFRSNLRRFAYSGRISATCSAQAPENQITIAMCGSLSSSVAVEAQVWGMSEGTRTRSGAWYWPM